MIASTSTKNKEQYNGAAGDKRGGCYGQVGHDKGGCPLKPLSPVDLGRFQALDEFESIYFKITCSLINYF